MVLDFLIAGKHDFIGLRFVPDAIVGDLEGFGTLTIVPKKYLKDYCLSSVNMKAIFLSMLTDKDKIQING